MYNLHLKYSFEIIPLIVELTKKYIRKQNYNTTILKDPVKFAIDMYGILLTEYHIGFDTQNDHYNTLAIVYQQMLDTDEYRLCKVKMDILNNWVQLAKED